MVPGPGAALSASEGIALFAEAAAANREALRALRRGEAAAALEPLFRRKAAITAELQRLRAELPAASDRGADKMVRRALDAQKDAESTELELSLQLGNGVPRSDKLARAYAQKPLAKPSQRLDNQV